MKEELIVFEIKIKVNGNGTLNVGYPDRLKLGTANEVNRVKLVFDVDSSIEGVYQYVKFNKGNTAHLFRVNQKEIVLSKKVLASAGVWLFSFISTDAGIVNNQITGTYAYISEPIEAVVVDGILDKGLLNEDETVLKSLIEMTTEKLVLPEYIESIGNYFLYNAGKIIDLTLNSKIKSIGTYALYGNTISRLRIPEDCELTTLKDYALYNVFFNNDIMIPPSVTTWGKYVLKNSTVFCLDFHSNSKIETLGSYALWENNIEEIYLPANLKTLSGNTYVIKNCESLCYLWIPNSITTPIPANAIYGCTSLETIELEEDFNVSANFSNCTNLSAVSIVSMFHSLKDLSGTTAKTLTLGATNLAKVTEQDLDIALDKNWTIS